MTHLDYHISNHYFPRRTNWRDFVDTIHGTPHHTHAILSLHFNYFENTKRLLNYLQTEKNQNFDIIFVENSTNPSEKEKLLQYSKLLRNCTILTPIANVGSAGGYALGMEYILSHAYEYFFLVEDDIILTQKQTFSEMMNVADTQTLTFINTCKNCWTSSHPRDKGKSWWVQIAGYPTSFVKKIGGIDPRYFFRAEDLERGERIEKGIKAYQYHVKIIDHNYLHPYLKPINGNYTRLYFSIRNQLLRFVKQSKGKSRLFVVLFFYLRTALDKILIEWDRGIFKAFCSAIWDFLSNNSSFHHNQTKINAFMDASKALPVHQVKNSDIAHLTKDLFSTNFFLGLTGTDQEKLQYSTKFLHFFTRGVLISANTTITYPLFILAPKILCINEFDLKNGYIYINNSSLGGSIWKWISSTLTALISAVTIIIINMLLLIYIGIKKFLFISYYNEHSQKGYTSFQKGNTIG